MDYKEQIEKEAQDFAKNTNNGYFINQDGREKGFISGVNSKISERIKVEFAISVLEEIKLPLLEDWDSFAVKRIENKITELKKQYKMKNVIQITDKILGVIVPSDAYDFEFIHNKTRVGYKIDHRLSYIDLPKGNFKIHGICTLPAFDFDFEPIMGKEELTDLIQKAIQDEGMFVVNPYGENKPQELVDYTGRKDGIIANSLELEQWKSSESKTVKKLLIIEKN